MSIELAQKLIKCFGLGENVQKFQLSFDFNDPIVKVSCVKVIFQNDEVFESLKDYMLVRADDEIVKNLEGGEVRPYTERQF